MATNKFLDLAGLQHYDGKIKDWIRNGEDEIKVASSKFTIPSGKTSATVKSALDELADNLGSGTAAVKLSIEDTTGGAGDAYSKRYDFYLGREKDTSQNVTKPGTKIGTIDIAKDMVVSGGQIVTFATDAAAEAAAGTGATAGKYIELTIANATSDKLYIAASDLVDIYTAQQSATQIQLAISASNEISATVVAGSITATELATDAVETAKIKDANVTHAKLADDAVETNNIKDANVTHDKIADNAVEANNIKANAVETAKINDGAVTLAKIGDDVPIPNSYIDYFVFGEGTDPTAP